MTRKHGKPGHVALSNHQTPRRHRPGDEIAQRRRRTVSDVPAPPADLFRRNPTAFHLRAELDSTPRAVITTD
jgi:hypothetical protein